MMPRSITLPKNEFTEKNCSPFLSLLCPGNGSKIFLLFLTVIYVEGCGSPRFVINPNRDAPARIAVVGFKLTPRIKHLSTIQTVQTKPSEEEEPLLLEKARRGIEEEATLLMAAHLGETGAFQVFVIPPDSDEGRKLQLLPGEKPSVEQREVLKKDLDIDAVLDGKIPEYGKVRLLYSFLGIGLDTAAETVVLGVATHWNPTLIWANVGFELLTSTPIWFGGAYLFGWAFRPVTVEAWLIRTDPEGTLLWKGEEDKLVSRKILRKFPEEERKLKQRQLRSSIEAAIQQLAKEIAKKSK